MQLNPETTILWQDLCSSLSARHYNLASWESASAQGNAAMELTLPRTHLISPLSKTEASRWRNLR